MDLHHPLMREFPEHVETIRRLKLESDSFRKLFDEYHTVDDAICRIEEATDDATDQQILELKTRRAWLKDELYHRVQRATVSR